MRPGSLLRVRPAVTKRDARSVWQAARAWWNGSPDRYFRRIAMIDIFLILYPARVTREIARQRQEHSGSSASKSSGAPHSGKMRALPGAYFSRLHGMKPTEIGSKEPHDGTFARNPL